MNYLKLLASVLGCELAGALGSLLMGNSLSSWYLGLTKPTLTPPSYVFAPVWITLYALMGIALYLYVESDGAPWGYVAFAGQLTLNMLWSYLFFGQQLVIIALFDLFIILTLTLVTMVLFYRSSRTAAYLLLPYVAWLSIATYLNYMILMLNP